MLGIKQQVTEHGRYRTRFIIHGHKEGDKDLTMHTLRNIQQR